MSNDELISVIVPVYNVEKYLEKCITSILDQTYQNLEIILVDDGSTDHCNIICDSFAEKDSRIHVIHKSNTGLADARNVGIEHSKGRYISFIDSDDYIHSSMLEVLYQALKSDDADISICNSCAVDEDYQPIPGWNTDVSLTYGVITGEQAIQKLFGNKTGYYIVAWNKLYKRELFREVRYPYGHVNEDEFVIHRLFGQCRRVTCLQDALYYYLQRPESIMGRINRNRTIEYYLNITDFMIDRMFYLGSINLEQYAAEAYRSSVVMYEKVSSMECDKVQRRRKKTIKTILQKNFSVSKPLERKKRILLFLICINPKLKKICVRIKTVIKGIGQYSVIEH